MMEDEFYKRAIEETYIKLRDDGYNYQLETVGETALYTLSKDEKEVGQIRVAKTNEIWKVSIDPKDSQDAKKIFQVFWKGVQESVNTFRRFATTKVQPAKISEAKQRTEIEKDINFKQLDEFREKKYYGFLLKEYQALLVFIGRMPDPKSIRKEIRSIALHYNVDLVEEHENEDELSFEFQRNGHTHFITVATEPQSEIALTPPPGWRTGKFILVKVSRKGTASINYERKIALAALCKAVLSEDNGFTDDVIPKLIDDAELIFKEFNENPESESQTKPQSGKAGRPPLSDDELADRKDAVDKWQKKSKECGRQIAAHIVGTPYNTLLSWERKVYPRNE